MSFDIIIPKSKAIEAQLRRLGYIGKGIHGLITSAGDDLPNDVCRAARKVATIRNKVIHDARYTLTDDDLSAFLESAGFVSRELNHIWRRRKRSQKKAGAAASQRNRDSSVWIKGGTAIIGVAVLIAALVFGASKR